MDTLDGLGSEASDILPRATTAAENGAFTLDHNDRRRRKGKRKASSNRRLKQELGEEQTDTGGRCCL